MMDADGFCSTSGCLPQNESILQELMPILALVSCANLSTWTFPCVPTLRSKPPQLTVMFFAKYCLCRCFHESSGIIDFAIPSAVFANSLSKSMRTLTRCHLTGQAGSFWTCCSFGFHVPRGSGSPPPRLDETNVQELTCGKMFVVRSESQPIHTASSCVRSSHGTNKPISPLSCPNQHAQTRFLDGLLLFLNFYQPHHIFVRISDHAGSLSCANSQSRRRPGPDPYSKTRMKWCNSNGVLTTSPKFSFGSFFLRKTNSSLCGPFICWRRSTCLQMCACSRRGGRSKREEAPLGAHASSGAERLIHEPIFGRYITFPVWVIRQCHRMLLTSSDPM